MNLMKWIAKNSPEWILTSLRPVYHDLRKYILSIADSLKIISPRTIYNQEYYSKRQEDPWRSDARSVAVEIRDYFEPDSVIDFGCAIGAHLEPLYEDNIEIKGVDGNPEAFEYAVVPSEHLSEHDLRYPYDPHKVYDLALCFEVAEHLPGEYADTLVDTLTKSSDIVVMTAAPPGQGGTHHVNEQPPEYWHQKFESRGFRYDSDTVQVLRNRIEVEEATWIQNNLMVFRSETDRF